MATPEPKREYAPYLEEVLDVRVMVTEESGAWFAQGLEVDYAAQGRSWLEVRKAFEDGLTATIDAHLRKYGHPSFFLNYHAPPDIWDDFRNASFENQEATSSLQLKKQFDRASMRFLKVLKREAAKKRAV